MSELTPLQQTVNLLLKAENILLLTHANPDGDGISSILALRAVLTQLGKKATAAAADPASSALHFLPELQNLENNIAGAHDLILHLPLSDGRRSPEVLSQVVDGQLQITVRVAGKPFDVDELVASRGHAAYDVIVICDTPELHLLGRLFETDPELFYDTPVVNIDHHASNTSYGRVNLLDTTAASSTELVTRIVKKLNEQTERNLIDADIATLLLTGIITDTGSFQNANTTPRSFEVAAELIEHGARQQEIIQNVYKTKQLSTLKLWGRTLSNIQADEQHRLVWSTLTAGDLTDCAAEDSESDGIIDELMTNAPGAEVVVLLKQNGVGVRGSVRTTTAAVSASEIAGLFGGGGHLRAAGFKIAGATVENVRDEVLTKIRAYQAERLGLAPLPELTVNVAPTRPAAKIAGKPTAKKPTLAERIAAAAAR